MIVARARPQEVPALWPLCRPLLAKSYNRLVHADGPDDLLPGLLAGEFQLWAAVAGTAVVGAAVTVLEEGSQAKVCFITNLGGDRLPAWVHLMDDAISRFGIENGCAAYEYAGRAGFSRLVPGLKEDGRIYVKMLTE